MRTSEVLGALVVDAYLIFQHRVTNVLKQTAELIRILGVAEEAFNVPLGFQQGQILTNVLQFPGNPPRETQSLTLFNATHRSNLFLRSRSLVSSLETGAQSNLASALTRGASDSIACLFALVRWGASKRYRGV